MFGIIQEFIAIVRNWVPDSKLHLRLHLSITYAGVNMSHSMCSCFYVARSHVHTRAQLANKKGNFPLQEVVGATCGHNQAVKEAEF